MEDVKDFQAFSPLSLENIELECNSDHAVLHAFSELLLDTYHESELKHLAINKVDDSINFRAMKEDHIKVQEAVNLLNEKANKFPYFQIRDLSAANWFNII